MPTLTLLVVAGGAGPGRARYRGRMRAAVIDLGLLEPAAGSPAGSVDDLGAGGGRAWAGGSGWERAGLVVALLLLLVTGSVASASPGLAPLWILPGPFAYRVEISGQSLYALQENDHSWVLSAYDLDSGGARWAVEVDGSGGWPDLRLVQDQPLLTTPGPDRRYRVTAYAPVTGAELWRQVGYVYAVAGDRLLLASDVAGAWPRDDGTVPGDGRRAYQVAVVDAGTGAVAWTRGFEVGEVVIRSSGGDLTQLVTWDRDGRLTRYDLATGVVRAQVQTPTVPGRARPAAPPDVGAWVGPRTTGQGAHSLHGWSWPYLDPADGSVVVPGPAELASYDAETLGLRWRVSLPGRAWAVPCGALVCAGGGPDGAIAAVDPGSGQLRWSLSCQADPPSYRARGRPGEPCQFTPLALQADSALLVAQGPVRVGAARAGGTAVDPATSVWAVDPATGERLSGLETWHLLAWPAVNGAGWLTGGLVWPPVDGAGWLVGRSDPAGERWLAWWDPATGRFPVLGTIDVTWCHPPASGHLACRTADGTTQVWRTDL